MGVFRNGIELAMPFRNGVQCNAFRNGQLVWGEDVEIPHVELSPP
jgi:hypothetical protein